jgi:hypothetical protein
MNRDQRAPAGVRSPRDGGWLAAGEDHDVVGRPGRDQILAKPAVDRGELLVPVDQENRPALRTVRACALGGIRAIDGLGEPVR